MAGHGRPPVEDPKTVKVGFRVSEAERDRLLAYCEKMNLTQSQVLKEALELLYKTKPQEAVPSIKEQEEQEMAQSRKDSRGYALRSGEC